MTPLATIRLSVETLAAAWRATFGEGVTVPTPADLQPWLTAEERVVAEAMAKDESKYVRKGE